MLDVKPVRRRSTPRYPTYDYLQEHPELLRLVPERWRQNALALKVLGGAVCLVLASQAHAADQQPNAAASSRIAPLFLHGEGRGAFGCIAINPPVFLSEDEARQVIREEAKKAGLELAPDALAIRDVAVPPTARFPCVGTVWPGGPAASQQTTQTLTLILDGFDRQHDVAYEFVSVDDFSAWETKNPQCVSSVYSIDAKGAAEKLRSGMKPSASQPWLGVFYEPMAGHVNIRELRSPIDTQERLATFERRLLEGRKVGAEELRKQVRDFIQWLKAQGVI